MQVHVDTGLNIPSTLLCVKAYLCMPNEPGPDYPPPPPPSFTPIAGSYVTNGNFLRRDWEKKLSGLGMCCIECHWKRGGIYGLTALHSFPLPIPSQYPKPWIKGKDSGCLCLHPETRHCKNGEPNTPIYISFSFFVQSNPPPRRDSLQPNLRCFW